MYGAETLRVTATAGRSTESAFSARLYAITDRAERAGLMMSTPAGTPEVERAAWVPETSAQWDGHIDRTPDGFTIVSDGVPTPYAVPGVEGIGVKRRSQAEEMESLLELRDSARQVLELEAANREDTDELAEARGQLRASYERYVDRFGAINRFTESTSSRSNSAGDPVVIRRAPAAVVKFRKDPFFPLVAALEVFDEQTRQGSPAAIQHTRQVAPRQPALGADSAEDALAITVESAGRVDLDHIAHLLGTDAEDARRQLGTSVFEVPDTNELVTRADYLSGNVRVKLAAAEAAAQGDDRFSINARELREALPAPLRMDEVEARIGAVWISPADHQTFLAELVREPAVSVAGAASTWTVKGGRHTLRATEEWGTDRMPAGVILERLLEQRSITVTDEFEDGTRVVNAEATAAAQEKAGAIQERFSEWVWEDPERATRLLAEYNDRFNSIVLRDYTAEGQALTLPGMAHTMPPRPHQRAAVARMLAEPAVGLFHQVGAGKTAEMVMGVMELKRLGMARKPAVVVPNHMLEQFSREWLGWYPRARILAASIDDLTKDRRRAFVARVATNDWDAVVMTRTAFERLSLSPEQMAAYEAREVDRLRTAVTTANETDAGLAGRSLVKRLEKRVAREEQRIKKLQDKPADPGISFEESGIDYLVIDEMHDYKNLSTTTNIAGAAIQGSKRASDLHAKIEYLREREGRRVITGATATPIANSVTEMYVMQRYLRPDLLAAAGIEDFDSWAATFGQVVEGMELSVAGGDRFKVKARFAKFQNVPELLKMFHTFADVKTQEDLALPIPALAARGPQGARAPELVSVEPTPELSDYVADIGERVDQIAARGVDPSVDNMLKVSSDGRRAALDMRLVDPTIAPSGATKVDVAADLVASVYQATKDAVYLDADGEEETVRGALQLVFCDQGTPSQQWNVYDALRAELVARGVPAERVRFMQEATNDAQKARLFAAARAGHVSVLVGSTQRMGVGTNVQKRAVHLVDLDAPWRPADVEQRHGRILRQGNQNAEVRISQVITVGSFDSFMWQGLERKSRFINSVMKGRLNVREIEDVGENTLSFAEAKAITSGNPLVLDKANADRELSRLTKLERAHQRSQSALRHTVRSEGQAVAGASADLATIDQAIETSVDTTGDAFTMTIDGRAYSSRTDAVEALAQWAGDPRTAAHLRRAEGHPFALAQVGGHQLLIEPIRQYEGEKPMVEVSLAAVPRTEYRMELTALRHPSVGTVRQLENRITALGSLAQHTRQRIEEGTDRVAAAEQMLGQPFKHADALTAARAEAARVEAAMTERAQDAHAEPAQPAQAGARLTALNAPNGHRAPTTAGAAPRPGAAPAVELER
ncbi:MAG: helicase-related protein [Actinomycetaceae bacterium]